MKIVFEKKAIKFLKSIQKSQRDNILNAIEGLTQKPAVGDIKKMSGFENKYRLRVGKYRIIYKYDTDNNIEVLLIMDIGSRGDIYK